MKKHRKVLRLSAHFEADGVIDVMRALSLVRRGAARVELWDPNSETVKTSTTEYRIPSIVVLTTYHNLRKKRQHTYKQRLRIFIRDGFRCQYCCKRFQAHELTRDHIVPQSKGGLDVPENLATACKPCNQRKADRTPDEARMPLLATPSALNYGLDRASLVHEAQRYPEWNDYIYLEKVKAVA